MIRATTRPGAKYGARCVRALLRGCKIRAVLFSLLALTACVGCQQVSGEQTAGEPKGGQDGRAEAHAGDAEATAGSTAGDGAVARAGDAVARAGGGAEARAGDAVAKESVEEGAAESRKAEGNAREATLEIEGDPGTEFSGKCAVGNEEKEIGGQVPERFVFELDGRKLECEIRKKSTGAMNIVLDAGEADYVQRTDSRWATVSIVYSGEGFSSSIQSSIGSSRQTISSGSSSIVSASSTSSR